MHYTHFPQINDIYSNSSFQRKRKVVRKNVGVLPSYVSLVIPVKIQSLCDLIMSGLLWLQEKKVSEFVDRLLKKQKFYLSKRLLLSLCLIFFHSKTVVQMFWNGGFKGWRDYGQPCIHCLSMLNKTDTFPNGLQVLFEGLNNTVKQQTNVMQHHLQWKLLVWKLKAGFLPPLWRPRPFFH